MIRGAIFDFDGTLFDTMGIWDELIAEAFCELGCEYTPELLNKLKVMSFQESTAFLKETFHIPETEEEIRERIDRMAEEQYFYKVLPKPGAPEFLAALHSRGVKMCIATATERYMVKAALERCGLASYFSDILACADTGRGKEAPDIFRAALKSLGTERDDTAVFEDSAHALRTAARDGFRTVGIFDRHEVESETAREFSKLYLPDFRDMSGFWVLFGEQA